MTDIKYNKVLTLLFVMLMPAMLFAQVMNISGGLKVVANGNVSIVMDKAGIINNGTFIPGNSTVYFSGAATTTISGSQPVDFYNIIFQGTGTKLNNGNAAVIGTLGVEGTTVFDADGNSNDKTFVLRSSDTATARIDILTTGNITGDVTIERFINTGTDIGQHGKSWQFLATPTTGQTFFQSWQENGLTPTGYGTILTGTGTGFDITTTLPSVKFYDDVTATWTGVTNTATMLQNKFGYMLFVRGDRTVTTSSAPANNTNMRSRGALFTPFSPPPSVPVAANRFQSFGNPYASAIEFNNVYLASTGIDNVFYVWDPKLGGSNNLGGYQTISAVTGYMATAGGPATSYPAGIASPYIESGQAAFVHGNATGGNVVFNENCKVRCSRLVNKGTVTAGFVSSNRQFLQCSLFTNTGMITDGNIVAFENGLGNEVNQFDAEKILNTGENFGISRDQKLLSVEARDAININDTIFYRFQNLRPQPYQLRFAPINISTTLSAYLIDRYSNSNTPISLIDSSFIDFVINADTASYAADRFILVFKQPDILPVTIVNIAARRNADQTNQITWSVENEKNIQEYSIERSPNGTAFNTIGYTSPSANNNGSSSYSYHDEMPLNEINFYRIKAASNSGQLQYSNIAKVERMNSVANISVYPNPVVDKMIHVSFNNQKQGMYILQLSNKAGQVIYTRAVKISEMNTVYTPGPGDVLASGTYQLCIIKEDGSKVVEQLMVK
jgi:hypothetical protein